MDQLLRFNLLNSLFFTLYSISLIVRLFGSWLTFGLIPPRSRQTNGGQPMR